MGSSARGTKSIPPRRSIKVEPFLNLHKPDIGRIKVSK